MTRRTKLAAAAAIVAAAAGVVIWTQAQPAPQPFFVGNPVGMPINPDAEGAFKPVSANVKVFGGGGGVIVPAEIERLAQSGVTIFSPEDGQRLGLAAMVNQIIAAGDFELDTSKTDLSTPAGIARAITAAENGRLNDGVRASAATTPVPILGITGTGGSGKSSLTDEIVRRFRV